MEINFENKDLKWFINTLKKMSDQISITRARLATVRIQACDKKIKKHMKFRSAMWTVIF